MKKRFLLLAIWIGLWMPVQAAADISVSITLERETATLSDAVRVVVGISGARRCDAPPVIEGLKPFRVAQGGSSSRVEIVNGRMTSGIDYTYYLSATRPGKFEIGPARVQIDGRTFQSNTVGLTIVKQDAHTSPARGPIFLSASVSANSAFVEEQVLYTLKLYLRTRVSNISLELPEQDHLRFQQLGKPKEYQGVLEGTPYQIVEVRYALMGIREGDYQIPPAQMEMTAYSGRQSERGSFDHPFFTDPFFNRRRPVRVSSEPLRLRISALPREGRPSDFSGLVGSFTIISRLLPPKIRAGESATLTVRVSGRGNGHRIPDLKLPVLDHLKVYADEPVFAAGHDQEGLTGAKTMKWAIVPELPGDYEIPPLSISFFDPKERAYRVIKSAVHALAVIPGKGKMLMVNAGKERENGSQRPEKEEIKEIGHDILPIHTSLRGLENRAWARFRWPLLWGILFLPPFLYGSTRLGLRLRKRSVQTVSLQRARKAGKHLIHQCRGYERDNPEYLLLIARNYFNDRFGLSLAALTPEEAVGILTDNGVAPETAEKLRNVLEGIENAVYAADRRGLSGVGKTLPGIIKAIEKEIR